HDFEDPMAHSHNRVEGKLEYTSLLYIPKRAPFDMWEQDRKHGIKLYVKRVFVMDDAEHIMPNYLRFVRGVIDSSDLPLNVSREILQHNKVIDSIRSGSVKKVLGLLESMAKNDAEKYQLFWEQFGKVMKEGPGEDSANQEQVAKLLRFATTHTDSETQNISLDDYIARMKEGQDKIYYITADSFAAVKNSPHLEIFRKKEVEVLLLADRVDEWLVGSLTEYDGRALQSVAKGELDLGELDDADEKKNQEEVAKDFEDLVKQVQEALNDAVKEVRITHRLTSSPACLVAGEHDMSANLERILKSVGQDGPGGKPILELNPEHPLVAKLKDEKDEQRFDDWSHILFDQAMLAEGGQLDDPGAFVSRLNQMLLELST
ncbi:MAG: molecular chaperone HtpG, partial [Gammaproteobacteria bacterium]|nr:molecular chaperone HtpG [Gammaproteobacteria bacterium]